MPIGFQCVELPPDEHVLKLVARGGDHGSAPVNIKSKSGKMCLPDWRKEFQPLVCVCKFVDVGAGDAHLEEDAVPFGGIDVGLVGYGPGLCVCELGQLLGETVGRGVDGTAGAVEAERPQYVLALQALEARLKLVFGRAEAMSEVQFAVHVRLWECHHLFGSVVWV